MFRTPKLHVLGIAVTALGLAVGASSVNGEIAKRDGPASMQPSGHVGPRLAADTPIRVECWQDGKRIIVEEKLYGFSVNSLLDNSSLSFRRTPGGNVNVFILSLKHSTCLIRDASGRDGT